MKTDKEFLLWLADRLVLRYGESERLDWIRKLVSIAEAIPADQCTPNCGSWKVQQ